MSWFTSIQRIINHQCVRSLGWVFRKAATARILILGLSFWPIILGLEVWEPNCLAHVDNFLMMSVWLVGYVRPCALFGWLYNFD